MYFQSMAEALQMDGHGVYVWSAYLIAIVVVSLMLLGPRRRQRQLLSQLAAQARRRQAAPDTESEEY